MPEDRNEHLVSNINDLLEGPLATANLTKDGALARVRSLYRLEQGYTDELVRGLDSFKNARFLGNELPQPPAPSQPPAPIDLKK